VLNLAVATGTRTEVTVAPARRAVVSWNTDEPVDTLELVVRCIDGRSSRALPYVTFEPGRRASLDGFDGTAAIETDVVSAAAEIVAIEVRSQHSLRRVAVSTPVHDGPPRVAAATVPAMLDVPLRSQYVPQVPHERGWCTPAAIAMLLGAHGIEREVGEVAAAVYDAGYRGTGNWTLNTAYAAAHGLAGAAAYLRDLISAHGFITRGIPLAASISWEPGELPGAPLERSAGHLVVIAGFDAHGDVVVNDPAQPAVRHVYPRGPFERCWLAHGGIALIAAREGQAGEIARCANR
jgi:hypothetical protein